MSNSPFKFLNAYQKEDVDFFFGREKETEDLYEMTYDTRLMVIVGASGTGKTSIVQCGLANKFKETRWNDIFIRRADNINTSIHEELDKELHETGGSEMGDAQSVFDKLDYIYRSTFKPIYLIFDQFEELFIVNPNKEEQEDFFQLIDKIIESPISCKVLLIMRDEFITHLWEYEKTIPTLFDHRYRIERMRSSKMEEVIVSTLQKHHEKLVIQAGERDAIATNIINALTESKAGLELTYLQVFLDRLFQEAEQNAERPPLFTPQLVEKMGALEDVIGEFLSAQIANLEEQLGPGKKGIPIRLLGAMITDEKTKKVLTDEDLERLRTQLNISAEELQLCIQSFQNMRILKQFD